MEAEMRKTYLNFSNDLELKEKLTNLILRLEQKDQDIQQLQNKIGFLEQEFQHVMHNKDILTHRTIKIQLFYRSRLQNARIKYNLLVREVLKRCKRQTNN